MTMIDAKWCRQQEACYDDERLAKLFDSPMTVRDVLTRQDGPWASVPTDHRWWVATRPGVLSDRVLRLCACFAARSALNAERAAGREPDARSWAAAEVAERFARGQATETELTAARGAAWAAARGATVAWEAAWDAALAAGRAATWYATWNANWDAIIDECVRLIDEEATS
jgi:hypothetical protein